MYCPSDHVSISEQQSHYFLSTYLATRDPELIDTRSFSSKVVKPDESTLAPDFSPPNVNMV